MILHKIAVLKAFILQQYYNLKSIDDLPFQMIHGDVENRRVVVPVPKRKPTPPKENKKTAR